MHLQSGENIKQIVIQPQAKGVFGRGQFVPQVPTFCAYFLHTVKNLILIKNF